MGDLHNAFHRLKIPPLRVGKSSGHGGWGQPHRFGNIPESNPLGLWIFGQPVLLARHTKWTRTGPLKIAALAIFGNNVVVRTFARYPLVTLEIKRLHHSVSFIPRSWTLKASLRNRFKSAKFVAIAAVAALAATGCASTSGDDEAGDFPSKDIRLVVPWEAGGSGDLSARTLAPQLEEELGVNVIVENRPGANGSVGYNWMTEQDPDGYNMVMVGAEIVTLQYLDYDIDPANYEFLSQLLSGPGGIAVSADSPYETLDDLIEDAKARPGEVTYSSPGVGSVWDNPAQGLQELADIELVNVPFDGSAPSIAAAAAGDVDFSIDAVGSQKAQVDGGEMRYLAVLTEERLEELPDVPTAKELGIDLQNASFTGLVVPEGTPDDVVDTLSEAIQNAAQSDEFRETIEASNLIPVGSSSDEFREFIEQEDERHSAWIKLAQGE